MESNDCPEGGGGASDIPCLPLGMADRQVTCNNADIQLLTQAWSRLYMQTRQHIPKPSWTWCGADLDHNVNGLIVCSSLFFLLLVYLHFFFSSTFQALSLTLHCNFRLSFDSTLQWGTVDAEIKVGKPEAVTAPLFKAWSRSECSCFIYSPEFCISDFCHHNYLSPFVPNSLST